MSPQNPKKKRKALSCVVTLSPVSLVLYIRKHSWCNLGIFKHQMSNLSNLHMHFLGGSTCIQGRRWLISTDCIKINTHCTEVDFKLVWESGRIETCQLQRINWIARIRIMHTSRYAMNCLNMTQTEQGRVGILSVYQIYCNWLHG